VGIITKAYTFLANTLAESAKVNTNFDQLFTEVNGGLNNENVSASANIAQSKIANLVSDMAARLLKAGDTMTGGLTIKMSGPTLRLIGTETSARDWFIGETAGIIVIYRNDGTEAVPVLTPVFTFPIDGNPVVNTDVATKLFVDGLVDQYSRSLNFARAVVVSGDATTNFTGFAGIAGLTTNITTRARRLRITLTATGEVAATTPATQGWVDFDIDGTRVGGGTQGLMTIGGQDGIGYIGPINASFITDVVTAATHAVSMQFRTNGNGLMTVRANTDQPAWLTVEELPF